MTELSTRRWTRLKALLVSDDEPREDQLRIGPALLVLGTMLVFAPGLIWLAGAAWIVGGLLLTYVLFRPVVVGWIDEIRRFTDNPVAHVVGRDYAIAGVPFNWHGFWMTVGCAAVVIGLGELTFIPGPVKEASFGGLLLVLDVMYRRPRSGTRREDLFSSKRGGSIFWLPIWLWGAGLLIGWGILTAAGG